MNPIKISVYCTEEERELIKQRAKEANLSRSAYILKCALGDEYERENPRPYAPYGSDGKYNQNAEN